METASSTVTKRHSTAITLIELLVVVSLLALLAALFLPMLAQAREVGRRTTCISNLRQIATAHRLYVDTWDERFPHYRFKIDDDRELFWMTYLQPYMQSTAILRCPSSRERTPVGAAYADYALCTFGPGAGHTINDPYYRWPNATVTLSQVRRPGETVSVADGWTFLGGTIVDGGNLAAATPGHRVRHGRGLNAAFLDGHAGWLAAEEMWRIDTDEQGFFWLHYGTVDR